MHFPLPSIPSVNVTEILHVGWAIICVGQLRPPPLPPPDRSDVTLALPRTLPLSSPQWFPCRQWRLRFPGFLPWIYPWPHTELFVPELRFFAPTPPPLPLHGHVSQRPKGGPTRLSTHLPRSLPSSTRLRSLCLPVFYPPCLPVFYLLPQWLRSKRRRISDAQEWHELCYR